ncbi:MAG: NAD-dependent epimerase/dehydratase family protein [Anaerolineae bacterium]|nr:NAD-dependent epimerase/dehydratase family protein [Anaerolineae bacterium]
MLVAVTGAAGHAGNNLVRALLAQGRRVRALVHRDRRALEGLDVEIVEGDIRDLDSLRRALGGVKVVYHTAAYISLSTDEWPLLEAINVFGTRNVVEACLHCKVRRLVHFGSVHALVQKPLDVPLDESRSLATSRRYPPYDRSKALGEMEVREGIKRGLDAVIVYPTGMIGPYDFRPSHLGQVLLALCEKRLPALVAGGFDWVDVRDVVAGALEAEKHAPIGGGYLLPGRWASMRELAAMVQEITWTRPPRLVFPQWMARLGVPFGARFTRLDGEHPLYTPVSLRALRSNRVVSRERAARDLGYHPRPLQETLVDTLQWFAGEGRLSRPLALHVLEEA